LSDEMTCGGGEAGLMYVTRLEVAPDERLVSAVHVEPLLVEVNSLAAAYGFVLLKPVFTQMQV